MWFTIVFIVLIGIIIFLYWQTGIVSGLAKNYLNNVLEGKGRISYTSLRGSLINNIEIENLEIELYDQLKISSQYIELQYNLWPLFSNRVEVSKIFVDRLDVDILSGQPEPEPQPGEPFNIDTLLTQIQHTNYIDTVLNLLPEIYVRNAELYAGSLRFSGAPATFNDLYLAFSANIKKDQYRLKLDNLRAFWKEKNFPIKHAGFELKGDRKHFTLNQVKLSSNKSWVNASAYYDLRDTINTNLNLHEFYLDFADLNRLSGMDTLDRGYLSGAFSVSGAPVDFGADLNISGKWRNIDLENLIVDMIYKDARYDIRQLKLISNVGKLNLRASGSQFGGARGNVTFSDLNLKMLPVGLFTTDIDGRLNFDIKDYKLNRATGKGSLLLYHTTLDSIPFDTLMLNLHADRGNFRFSKPSKLRLTENSQFFLEGTLSRQKIIDLSLLTFDNNLNDLMHTFAVDSVFGIFDAQLRLTGDLNDPDISGNVLMPYFKYQFVDMDSLTLRLYVMDVLSRRKGEASFTVDSGRVGEMPLNALRIESEIDSNIVNISEILLKSEDNFLKSAINVAFLKNQTEIKIPLFKTEYEKYWLENDGVLFFKIDSSGVIIEHLRLKGPENSALEASGFWDNSVQDLQAFISFHKMELKPFEQFWNRTFTLSGAVNGSAEIIDPLRDMNLDIDLQINDLVFDGVALGQVHSKYQFADSTFFVNELGFDHGDMHFEASGALAFALSKEKKTGIDILEETKADLKMRWHNIELQHFAPLIKDSRGLSGKLDGYLEVSGEVNRPFLRHHMTIDRFKYDDFKVDSLRMYSQYNDGYIILDSLSALLNGTEFSLMGWQKYELVLSQIDTNFTSKPFQLYLKSKDDEIRFLRELNDQVESINGNYEMEIYLGGTLDNPSISGGNISLTDGSILLSRVKDPIENVQFEAVIEDSVLQFKRFSGTSVKEKDIWEKSWRFLKALAPWTKRTVREGYLEIGGSIDLAEITRPGLDLEIKMDELYIDYFVENTKLLLTTNDLSIKGRDTLFITGDIYVPQGEYEVDLSKMEKNVYLTSASVRQSVPYIVMNMDVSLPGNFVITSSPLDLTNNFKIAITGDLQTSMEAGADQVQVTGHLEVVSGKYNSWNQNFEVQSGAIDFKNPNEINPDIDIVAIKRLGDRIFELIITGNLNDLDQNIRITENGRELGLSYLDKIALLTFGSDIGTFQTNADSAIRNIGEDVATTSILTAVERGAEQYTGLDKVEINKNKSLIDLNKMRLNNGLEDASIAFGKYLTSDLYIEYRTQFGGSVPMPRLSWDAGNRLGLEYRLNRYWKLDTYYEKTILGNNKVQIGLNWEYTF